MGAFQAVARVADSAKARGVAYGSLKFVLCHGRLTPLPASYSYVREARITSVQSREPRRRSASTGSPRLCLISSRRRLREPV